MTRTRPAYLAIVGATCTVLLSLSLTTEAHAFFESGLEIFLVPGGSSTLESETTLGEMSNGKMTIDRDDSSGLGYTLYGQTSFVPLFGAGLALHLLPSVEFLDPDKTAHTLGSQFDINLRLISNLPIPQVNVTLFAEGGPSIFSLDDSFQKENNLETIESNEAATFGFSVGGGAVVGYSFTPFFGAHIGLAYQYYAFEIFKGSREDPSLGDQESVATLSGGRVRLSLGVDFGF